MRILLILALSAALAAAVLVINLPANSSSLSIFGSSNSAPTNASTNANTNANNASEYAPGGSKAITVPTIAPNPNPDPNPDQSAAPPASITAAPVKPVEAGPTVQASGSCKTRIKITGNGFPPKSKIRLIVKGPNGKEFKPSQLAHNGLRLATDKGELPANVGWSCRGDAPGTYNITFIGEQPGIPPGISFAVQ